MSSDETEPARPGLERTLTAGGSTTADTTGDLGSADTRINEGGDVSSTGADFAELAEVDPRNYTFGNEFARGGMGRIVAMRDRRLGRRVAVKELLKDSPGLVRRFQREVLITSQLQHPAIVSVYEAGRWPTGEPFFAMKLVDGKSLKEVIEVTETVADRMALLPNIITVVDALAYAHEHRVIHRDLKPANVLIGDFGETVVIDWGLAKKLGATEADDDADDAVSGASSEATAAGAVIGTPAYMAPEQAHGDEATERTDVYALGAMLYTTLAGSSPYAGPTANSVLAQVATEPPVPLTERATDIPADLHTIVAKAMARDPADRYASAVELARDLNQFQTGQLVGAHDYNIRALLRRWVGRHKTAVLVGFAAAVVLAIVAYVSVTRVVSERDRARQAEGAARLAEADSKIRADELVLSHARSIIDSDPLAALRWLNKLSVNTTKWRAARTIAARAHSRGLPRTIDAAVDDVEDYAISPDGKTIAVISDDEHQNRDWLLIDIATGKARRGGSHTARIQSIAYAPDGKSLATASNDNSIRVWNAATGQSRTFRGHQGWVLATWFSGGGTRLGSLSLDGTARLWDVATGKSTIFARGTFQLNLSKDSRIVATISPKKRKTLQLRWLDTDKAHELVGHPGRITTHNFSRDNTRIATADITGEVRVWDLATRKGTLLGKHDGAVLQVNWSRDGAQLATASNDHTVRIWDPHTGKHWAYREHTDRVVRAIFSRDGRWLATRSSDNTVRLIDLKRKTGRLLAKSRTHVQFMPDSKHVVTVNPRGDFELWTVAGGSSGVLVTSKDVRSLAYSKDGKRVLSSGGDWSLRLLDTKSGKVKLLRGHKASTLHAVLSPDNRLAASLSSLRRVRLWELATGKSTELPGLATQHLAFSPDGEYLAAPGDQETVRLWHLRTGTLRTLRGHRGWVKRVAFSPTRHELASVGSDGTVRVWNTKTGKGTVVGKHDGPCHDVVFSPDGNRMASGGEDKLVYVWPRAGRKRSFKGHERWVNRVVFSPDGKHLASAGSDKRIRVWNLATGKVNVLRGHSRPVHTLAYAPHGRSLVSASTGKSVRLWDVATGESRELSGHKALVRSLAWAPDGNSVLSGSADGTIRSWSDTLPHERTALRKWLTGATKD